MSASRPITGEDVKINVCKSRSGEVASISVPDDLPASQILVYLDTQHHLGILNSPAEYVLYNITQEFEYAAGDSLRSRSTGEGDLIIVAERFPCGGAVSDLD